MYFDLAEQWRELAKRIEWLEQQQPDTPRR